MGAKRKKLVEKYGYDCKNAGHCIRLLIMGIEFLKNGRLKVYRDEDKQLFIDIKTGKYTLQEIQLMANNLIADIEQVFKESTLPMENDRRVIEQLLIDVIKSCNKD